MKKNSKRIVSVSLSIAMMLSLCSFKSITPILDTDSTESTQQFYDFEKVPKNIKDLVGVESGNTKNAISSESIKTTEFVKSDNLHEIITKNSDGTGKVETFTVPVKYKDDKGNVQFIDTSFVSNDLISKLSGYDYKNGANTKRVQFSKSADKGYKIDNDFTLSIYNPEKEKKESGYVTKESGCDDKFIYPNAYGEDTYVEYLNISNGVKENIVLEKNIGKNTFEFVFKSKTKDLILDNDSKTINVVDKNDNSKLDFVFSPLYVYDSYKLSDSDEKADTSFKHFTEDCHYEIASLNEGEYLITAVVSKEFLDNPNVVYPVTIDPNVDYPNFDVNVMDTFVQNGVTNSNTYTWDYLRFGYNSGCINSYIQFKMAPNFPNDAIITKATLSLTYRPGQTTGYMANIYRVNSPWVDKTLNINNQPSRGDYIDYSTTNNFTNLYFNITNDMLDLVLP